jgi:hypothetical protein
VPAAAFCLAFVAVAVATPPVSAVVLQLCLAAVEALPVVELVVSVAFFQISVVGAVHSGLVRLPERPIPGIGMRQEQTRSLFFSIKYFS